MRAWGTFFVIVGLLSGFFGLWAGLKFTLQPLLDHWHGIPPPVEHPRMGIGDIKFLAWLFFGGFLPGGLLLILFGRFLIRNAPKRRKPPLPPQGRPIREEDRY